MLLHHGQDEGLEHVVETVEVGTDDAVPLVVFHGGEGVVRGDSGIQHDPVGRALFGDPILERRARRGAIGDVELQNPARAARRTHLRGGFLGGGASLDAVDDGIVPRPDQIKRNRAADAAAGTCDDNFLHV